jgi:hypothetical protein
VIEHPEYDDWTLDNDIVILKIATNLVEGPSIRRAQLPSPSHYVPSGLDVNLINFIKKLIFEIFLKYFAGCCVWFW